MLEEHDWCLERTTGQRLRDGFRVVLHQAKQKQKSFEEIVADEDGEANNRQDQVAHD